MATTNMRIVIRRDTSTNWNNVGASVVLLAGEQGYETNTGKMKVGNGEDVWNDLPYYTGGITDIDHDTIIMDAAGVISLNEDSVIGDLGTALNVKDYVDIKDDALALSIANEAAAREAADEAEASVREDADTALGARIDQEIISRGAVDSELQTAIADIGDRVVVLESVSATKDEISDANDSIADVANDLGHFKTQTQAEFDSQANMIIDLQVADTVESAARAAGDESVAGMLSDSVTALEAADADEVLARIAGDESVAGMLADSVDALELVDAGLASDLQDSVTALELVDAGLDERLDTVESELDRIGVNVEDDDSIKGRFYRVFFGDPTSFYVDDNTAAAAGVSVGELYLRGATIETAVLSVRMV